MLHSSLTWSFRKKNDPLLDLPKPRVDLTRTADAWSRQSVRAAKPFVYIKQGIRARCASIQTPRCRDSSTDAVAAPPH